jgi:putative ABC transport system permease protein
MTHEIPYLAVVLLTAIAAIAVAVRRRVLFRMAVRNAARRKTQVALAIAGLLVATSILSGSFVVGDSLRFAIRGDAFRSLDEIDETIVLGGQLDFYDAREFANLTALAAEMPHVDALADRIHATAAVFHPDEQLSEARANLIGVNASRDPGAFVLSDGTRTDGSALAGNRTYVNEELAAAVQARAGSHLTLFLGSAPVNVTVEDVLRSEGKALWNNAPNLFLPLSEVQRILGRTGEINVIVVSNVGGVEDGQLATSSAVEELDAALGAGHPYTIEAVKQDRIEAADQAANQLTDLFSLLGVFTVLAGLMLITSIVVMLAEERKTEMGIQRAVGLRRAHLTQLFSLEGFLYALAAAAIGALAGLGVAAVILYVVGQILFPASGIALRWDISSLTLGFALGFLLTLGAIVLSSGRISRLNIVRAIRNIPEPTTRKLTIGQIILGILLFVFGLLALLGGAALGDGAVFTGGVALIPMGIAVLVHKRVGARLAFTSAGLFLVVWNLIPVQLFPGAAVIALFIVTGIMMIAGGVLLVVFNNDLILGFLGRTIGRRQKLQPILRTAIAYPMARKGRTGLTVGIFALIVFTIVVMAAVQSLIGSSIRTFTAEASGGYDLFGIANPDAPVLDDMGLPTTFADRLASSTVGANLTHHEELLFGRGTVDPPNGDEAFYELYGFDTEFADRNGFSLYQRAPAYDTDREAWQAVFADGNLTIVDRSVQTIDFGANNGIFRLDIGDEVVVRNGAGTNRTVQIVGILDSSIVRGLFLNASFVRDNFGAVRPSFFMFKLNPGADGITVGRELERTFVAVQMQTFFLAALVEESTATTNAFFDLLEGYLAMGLLVGMAGLGIITMRNVVERRSEIGALRAIGFRRSMVLKSLLIETSYVALVGIAIGVVLGVLLGYRIWLDFLTQADAYIVPWDRILIVSAVAYLAAMATTVSPSVHAARLPPAEALRYTE